MCRSLHALSRRALAITVVGAAALVAMGCAKPTPPPKTAKARSPGGGSGSGTARRRLPTAFRRGPQLAADHVKVELYLMSKCRWGRPLEKALLPLVRKLGPRLDLQLDYIATGTARGGFRSMHGPSEVQGDIIQLCAKKRYPDARHHLPFVICMSETMRQIPNNWRGCATQNNLVAARIDSCAKGDEGKKLLEASLARAKARRANGCPTMYVGGKLYRSRRDTTAVLRAICDVMPGKKPELCATLPEPYNVRLTVLTDRRCKRCNVKGGVANLRGRFFPKLTVNVVQYGSAEGKRLYKLAKQRKVPIWLFAADTTKARGYARLKRWLTKRGSYLKLRMPAHFDPTAEICDNKKDDTGNGKVDCKDPTCKGKLVCRKPRRRRLDLFAMSQCPFARRALLALGPLLKQLGRKVRFDLHYIAKRKGKGFSSLHGAAEVAENKRVLCAKHYARKSKGFRRRRRWLRYVICRKKTGYRSTRWQPCARKVGLSARRIAACEAGKLGTKLLAKDIRLAKLLGITGSPTFLVNNRYKLAGLTGAKIKRAFCARNKKLAACR